DHYRLVVNLEVVGSNPGRIRLPTLVFDAVHHRVLHPVLVIAGGEVLPVVPAAGFLPVQGRSDDRFGEVEHETELEGFHEFGVEPLALILYRDPVVTLLQFLHLRLRLLQRFGGAEHLYVRVHRLLQVPADVSDPLAHVTGEHRLEFGGDERFGVLRKLDVVGPAGVFRGGDAGAAPENVDIEQGVRAQPVRPVHRYARDLAGRVQPRHNVLV